MTTLTLKIILLSDATFGRGDGVAGLVDVEVQHDRFGCPYLGGRALKGLLAEECANLLFALNEAGKADPWIPIADRLFGRPGSTARDRAALSVGRAQLPADLRRVIAQTDALSRIQVLESLTTVRRQTAVDPETDAPMDETLRTMRVILRETPFEATLYLDAGSPLLEGEKDRLLGLLAACVKSLRQAGTGRNRGRGELTAELYDNDGNEVTDDYLSYFVADVLIEDVEGRATEAQQ